MRTRFKTTSLAAMFALALVGAATAAEVSVDMFDNSTPCQGGANVKCTAGGACEMFVRITGPAAQRMIKGLKAYSKPVPEFVELGLTIYQTSDSLFSCDASDVENQFCDLHVDLGQSTVVPATVCE